MTGASVPQTGLSQVEPVSRLDPSGFDPSREQMFALPISAGWVAWDRDECTVTIALDSEEQTFALLNRLTPRNRVRLVSDDPDASLLALIVEMDDAVDDCCGCLGHCESEMRVRINAARQLYAIAMEARQGGNEVPSRSDDSAGPKDIAPTPDPSNERESGQ